MSTLVLQQKCEKSLFESKFLALLDIMQCWLERRHQRQQLAQLDPHMLKDIGVDVTQQNHEVNKPFWK